MQRLDRAWSKAGKLELETLVRGLEARSRAVADPQVCATLSYSVTCTGLTVLCVSPSCLVLASAAGLPLTTPVNLQDSELSESETETDSDNHNNHANSLNVTVAETGTVVATSAAHTSTLVDSGTRNTPGHLYHPPSAVEAGESAPTTLLETIAVSTVSSTASSTIERRVATAAPPFGSSRNGSGKKTQRASFSFLGPSSSSSSNSRDGGAPRIRTHSQLTPGSVQRIIGAVLPMDFREAPRPTAFKQGLSTSLASLTAEVGIGADSLEKPIKPARNVETAGEAASALASPTVEVPMVTLLCTPSGVPGATTAAEHDNCVTSEAEAQALSTAADAGTCPSSSSYRSSKSFATVTSSLSPPVAPQAEFSVPPPPARRFAHVDDANADTEAGGKAQSVDSTVSAPVTSAASSMTLREDELIQCASASNSVPDSRPSANATAGLLTVPALLSCASAAIEAAGVPHQQQPVKRSMSSHRLLAAPTRPALVVGPRNKSAARLGKSALQRSQSAKSVRIIEEPVHSRSSDQDSEDDVDEPKSHPVLTTASPPKVKRTNSRLSAATGAGALTKRAPSNSRLQAIRANTSPSLTSAQRNGSSSSNLSAHSASSSSMGGATTASRDRDGGPPRITSAQQLAEAYARAGAIAMKRSGSAASLAAKRDKDLIRSEPRSVSRGFVTPDQAQQAQIQQQSQHQAHIHNETSSIVDVTATRAAALAAAVPVSAASSMANNNPYAPHNSPSSLVPESVVLPPQPRPSPAGHVSLLQKRGWSHSSIRRPSSPPLPSGSPPGQAAQLPVPRLVRRQPTEDRQMRTNPPQAQAQVPPVAGAIDAQQNGQQTQQQQKKKGMFFLSSPTTDSDDESFGGRKASLDATAAAAAAAPQTDRHVTYSNKPLAANEMHRAAPAPPVASTSAAAAAAASNEDGDDDDAFEDEEDDDDDDDDSDWSSEETDSSVEERESASRAAAAAAAAALAEQERDRDMFAKRVPSAITSSGSGLLSRMLHPEEYGRGTANLPLELRRDQSALELAAKRPEGHLAGLERNSRNTVGAGSRPGQHCAGVTVVGLQASKSTAALSGLAANRPNAGAGVLARNGRSGNALTRLAGPPSGVELESDDSDSDVEDGDTASVDVDDNGRPGAISKVGKAGSGSGGSGSGRSGRPPRPTAVQLAHLMQRTKSANNVNLNMYAFQKASAAPAAASPIPPTPISTPRTIRRNMLSTELTESLRLGLLRERQSRPKMTHPAPAPSLAGAGGLAGVMQAVSSRFGRGAPQQQQQQQRNGHGQAQDDDGNPPAELTTDVRPYHDAERRRPPHLPPSAIVRRNSDPSANMTQYYSPGFHHV